MTTFHDRFHPYGEVGLGAALNSMKDFNAVTSETGSINVAPTYSNKTNTDFSYVLGLGIDAQVTDHVRAGLGYRYSYLGSSSLGNGAVIFKEYQYPVLLAIV
jgi:opacity protein-like surface antigen